MSISEIRSQIESKEVKILSETEMKNKTGVCLKTDKGQIVNVYYNGTVSVQGKNADQINFLPKKIAEWTATDVTEVQAAPAIDKSKNVFVVYGHDTHAKAEAEAMIRRWGLEPLFLDQIVNEGQTVIEKLEKYKVESSFAIVLATPCDEGFRVGHPEEKKFRCRQNVVMELGMMLSHFGRSRVAILLKDQENMERPSDINGLLYFAFKDSLDDIKLPLAKEMTSKDFKIDLGKV